MIVRSISAQRTGPAPEAWEADDGPVGIAARHGPGNIIGQKGADSSGLQLPVGGQGADGSPNTTSRRDRDGHEQL
jgi:hypothetical protein